MNIFRLARNFFTKQRITCSKMNEFKENWFTETEDNMSHSFNMKMDKVLYKGKSEYQDILVFNNKKFGNVLVLDNCVQATEFDEFSYQEMISFLPLNSHPNPEKVLIIGGGDGGVARECAKHPLVKEIYQCEIDSEVPRISKLYLPKMAAGFESEKLTLHIGDGFEFLKNHKNEFDVIITDSSDPQGPAESLFQIPFYTLMKEALNEKGIICCQGENLWIYEELIKTIVKFSGDLFPSVSYAVCQVPSYPPGIIGFIICSLEQSKKFSNPVHVYDDDETIQLEYYNSAVHRAAFVLPNKHVKLLKAASKSYSS